MAKRFILDGTYNISAPQFWKELYFSAEYTHDLLCHGLQHRAVELIQNEEQEYQIFLSKGGNCPKLRFVSDQKTSVISLKPKKHRLLQSLIP